MSNTNGSEDVGVYLYAIIIMIIICFIHVCMRHIFPCSLKESSVIFISHFDLCNFLYLFLALTNYFHKTKVFHFFVLPFISSIRVKLKWQFLICSIYFLPDKRFVLLKDIITRVLLINFT